MLYRSTCAACSEPFDAASPRATTCSDACRTALYRRRRAAKRAEAADALVAGLRGDAPALARGLAEAVDLLRPTVCTALDGSTLVPSMTKWVEE